jgi:hypothetical protein
VHFWQKVLKSFPNRRRTSAGLATLCLAAGVAAVATAAPAQALTWNFSATLDGINQTVSGTFETAGTTPIIGQVYTITSISGSVNGEAITGLIDSAGSNTFQWNGSPSSLVSDYIGINFSTLSEIFINLYLNSEGSGGYEAVDVWGTNSNGGVISSSSLSPVIPAGVPGPLPLFGAVAAFGWSRRLRRRVHPAR